MMPQMPKSPVALAMLVLVNACASHRTPELAGSDASMEGPDTGTDGSGAAPATPRWVQVLDAAGHANIAVFPGGGVVVASLDEVRLFGPDGDERWRQSIGGLAPFGSSALAVSPRGEIYFAGLMQAGNVSVEGSPKAEPPG